MNWIFIGLLAGSLVTSTHETEEACLGRAEVLKKKDVVGRCDKAPTSGLTINGSGSIRIWCGGSPCPQ